MTPDELRAEAERALGVAGPLLETLARLAGPDYPALLETLKPREGDAALAFLPPIAEPLAAHFRDLWEHPPRGLGVAPDQTQIRVSPATTALLQSPNPFADAFPGGYQRIGHLLAPGRVWVAWKYVRPGSPTGMAFDGLVHLDDRWAWFPKPWRGVASGAI